MKNHRHEPESNGWYTTTPNSSWNAECKVCGERIILVWRGKTNFWRACPRTPQFNFPEERQGSRAL